jgi:glycosyltransferase involved in cell wall biosynthesis
MPKDNPKVSIIIPTYNRAHMIERSIQSVFNQTYQYFEIIVIDDGSIDNTKDIISKLIKKYNTNSRKIKYYHQYNSGACVARNKGLLLSSGDYIQFLDSDDFIEKNKIKTQLKKIEKENTPCVLCDFQYIDYLGNVIKSVKNDGNIHEYVSNFRSVSIMTPLIKKTSILSSLKWNPKLRRNQDMDFIFRYFLSIENVSYTPGFFCKYNMHNDNRISDSYYKGIQCFELYRSFRNFFLKNKKEIPQNNYYLIKKYRNRLFHIFLIQNLKRPFPIATISILKKVRNIFNLY